MFAELQAVEWLGDANGSRRVAHDFGVTITTSAGHLGRRFAEIVEVDDDGDVRRWVWNVLVRDGDGATSAFEVEPASNSVLIRQWARMGPAPSA